MTLKPQISEEMEFVQIQKSKHARYIDGVKVVDADAIAGDYVAPGAVMGKITATGLYGPVTRGALDSVDSATNTFTFTSADEVWNLQVGDVLETVASGSVVTENVGDDLTITAINDAVVTVTAIASTEHNASDYAQKADGSSTGEFVCLELIDVSDDEDQLVGGMLHGAVFSGRMPNYDALVDADIPMISFE